MKNSAVKNPLTVISIFSGFAEVAGTAILPFVSQENQITYIWFLMFFPIFLVSLFFITLNFNSRVLYAPSDFKDEKNYMNLFGPSSAGERLEKIKEEALEQASDDVTSPLVQPVNPSEQATPKAQTDAISTSSMYSIFRRDIRSALELSNRAIERLASEYGTPANFEISLNNGRGRGRYVFDAVFKKDDQLILVEVKTFARSFNSGRLHISIQRIRDAIMEVPDSAQNNLRLVLVIVHDFPESLMEYFRKSCTEALSSFPIKSEVRLFKLSEIASPN